MMASCLSVYDVLERLDDDDDGPYSEDESDCEAEGISGYMPMMQMQRSAG